MSTRSLLGIRLPDKTIQWVYCHFDGYPENMEPKLHSYFNTYEDAYSLISKGQLRFIGEGLDDCNYAEENDISGIAKNLAEFLELDHWSDYKYLFYNGEWYWVQTWNYKYKPDYMDILPYEYKGITTDIDYEGD